MKLSLPRICATALTLGVMVLSVPAKADPVDAGAPPWLAQNPPIETPSSGSLPVGRMTLVVLVTAGLAVGAFYFRKRKLGSGDKGVDRRLQVLDTTRIGPKAQLVVVSVNGKMMLLGVTETNIRRLAWADPQVAAPEQQDKEQRDSFTGMLRSMMSDEDDTDKAAMPEQHPAAELALRTPLRTIETLTRTAEKARAEVPDSVEGQALGLTSRRGRRRA